MNATQIKASIAKMEQGLKNPNIQGAAKQALKKGLANAKKQLKDLESTDVPFIDYLNEVDDYLLDQYGYEDESDDAEQYTGMIADFQDEGLSPTQAAMTFAKHKKLRLKRSSKKTLTVAHSWKKKTALSKLKPININCEHYHLAVNEDTKVSLKRTGNTSIVVTAKKGDHIIFDQGGYAVYIMEAASFKRKCTPKAKPKPQAKTTPKPKRKATPRTKPSAYKKAINAFEAEVNKIRKQYNKNATDPQLTAELKNLSTKSSQKNYTDYVERKIKNLSKDGVRITKEEIIRIGIAIRPMVQSIRGTLQDTKTTNKKALSPTIENLIRWSKSPAKYDLIGVDAKVNKKPTTTAKVSKKEGKDWLKWLFGV